MTPEQYEASVKKWCEKVRRVAKQRAAAFSKGKKNSTRTYLTGRYAGKTEPKLKNAVRSRIHRTYGEIDNVAIVIPVHGIFRSYGVGNGQPVNATPPAGRIRRSPSDWITDPVDRNLEEFANLTGDYYGDRVLLNISGMKTQP